MPTRSIRPHADVRLHLAVAGPRPAGQDATSPEDRALGPLVSPPIPGLANHSEATCPGCIRERLAPR